MLTAPFAHAPPRLCHTVDKARRVDRRPVSHWHRVGHRADFRHGSMDHRRQQM